MVQLGSHEWEAVLEEGWGLLEGSVGSPNDWGRSQACWEGEGGQMAGSGLAIGSIRGGEAGVSSVWRRQPLRR